MSTKVIHVSNFAAKVEAKIKKQMQDLEQKLEEALGV